MMLGEYISISTMYSTTRDLVPRPIDWGTYSSNPDIHFFLCDFHDMTGQLPDLHKFPAGMADLHRDGTSPNGKYGFAVTTYHGNTPPESWMGRYVGRVLQHQNESTFLAGARSAGLQ